MDSELQDRLRSIEDEVDRNLVRNEKLLRSNERLAIVNRSLRRKSGRIHGEIRTLELRREVLMKDLLVLEHRSTLLEIRNMVNEFLKSFAENGSEQ